VGWRDPRHPTDPPHHRSALAHYEEALELRRVLGDRPAQVITLRHIADTYEATGDTTAAQTARDQALALLDEADRR